MGSIINVPKLFSSPLHDFGDIEPLLSLLYSVLRSSKVFPAPGCGKSTESLNGYMHTHTNTLTHTCRHTPTHTHTHSHTHTCTHTPTYTGRGGRIFKWIDVNYTLFE